MSQVLAMTLVGLLCLLIGVGLSAYATRYAVRRREDLSPQASPSPEVVQEPEPEAKDTGPYPIDPQHPPYFSYYRPKGGYDPERAPKCVCHGIRVSSGERLLLWPIPDHPDGGIDIFCAQTYGVMDL